MIYAQLCFMVMGLVTLLSYCLLMIILHHPYWSFVSEQAKTWGVGTMLLNAPSLLLIHWRAMSIVLGWSCWSCWQVECLLTGVLAFKLRFDFYYGLHALRAFYLKVDCFLCSSKPRLEQSLVRWAIPQLHDIDALGRMVDPALRGLYPPKSVSRFADVIALCVQVRANHPSPMPDGLVLLTVLCFC